MSYYIYGLRLAGDVECRYIGMTSHNPEKRVRELTADARSQLGCHPYRVTFDGLWQWLLDNQGKIEGFKIGRVETKAEALAMEKTIIALALRLGLRLLNVAHVPSGQRIGYVPTGWMQHLLDRREAAA